MYRRTTLISGAAIAIIASVAFAQQPRIPANRDLQNGAQVVQQQRVISQDEVRRSLEQAGFNNIEFLESAYVVRATNGSGTKMVMTITPDEIRTVELSPNRPADSTGQGSVTAAPNSGAGVPGQAGNKNGPAASSSGTQANRQAGQRNEAAGEQDSAKIPGKPGSKSGPSVMPPGEPK